MQRKTNRSRLLLFIAALFPYCCNFVSATPLSMAPDTLFITGGCTTYLLFDEPVALVDVGITSQYLTKIEGKCVLIKAAQEHTTPTSLLVQYGEEYFVAALAYKPLLKRFLYDFRRKTSIAEDVQNREGKDKNMDLTAIRKHFAAFQKLPQAVQRKSTRKHHLQFSLTHLQNDKQVTYLSFTLQNGSSIDYQIDLITFERKEKRGKRFSENNVHSTFIVPILSSDTKVVEAKTEAALHFAIPLYALGEKSHLKVSLREKNGSRMLSLKLPARYINQAAIFYH